MNNRNKGVREIKIEKRTRIVKLCAPITILGLLAYLFHGTGYLPIIGKMVAEKKLSEYSSVVKESAQKVETEYDWYNNKYQSISGNLSYRLQKDTIYDEAVAKQVNSAAKEQYNSIKEEFSENLKFPSGISVWTELNADDYSIKCQRLYLLGIYNVESISEEESQNMPATIAQEFINLMGKNYNFTGIQLIYFDKNGGYTIEISADTFKKLEYQDMIKKTRKMQEKELSEDYFEWLAKQ